MKSWLLHLDDIFFLVGCHIETERSLGVVAEAVRDNAVAELDHVIGKALLAGSVHAPCAFRGRAFLDDDAVPADHGARFLVEVTDKPEPALFVGDRRRVKLGPEGRGLGKKFNAGVGQWLAL